MKIFLQFRFDTQNQCLWQQGQDGEDQRILLAPKAFAVLRYLVEHAGRLVTHDELLDAGWPTTHVQPQAIKKVVQELRSLLGDGAKNSLCIETVHRRGYRFIAPVREETFQLPLIPSPQSPTELVGRDTPLAKLREQFEKALTGERQIVFISGEPGIGKTALVDEFQRRVAEELPGVRIARGQCIEGYGGKELYYPMLEALGQLCRGTGGESAIDALAAQAPTWLVQLPALLKRESRERLQREIIGATRGRMLREIGDALETIAATTPLLLVFEDLQWVDHATVDLVAAVARRRGPVRLMLVGTMRPLNAMVAADPLEALKEELLVHGLCHELVLRGLTETEIVEYLTGASSKDVPPKGLAKLLHRHTEGNPLFMVAALEHMSQRGLATKEEGAWKLEVPLREIALEVPQKLRRMIETQIDALSEQEQRVLEAASVEGQIFSAGVSFEAAKLNRDLFEELCQKLSRRQYIIEPAESQKLPDGTLLSRHKFIHALYREACYRRQAPERRAKLHHEIGKRLEALFAERLIEVTAELAHHFEAASDWALAIKYLQLEAELAGRRYAPREAAATLQHALDLLENLPDQKRGSDEVAILEKLATIHYVSQDIRGLDIWKRLDNRAAQLGLRNVQVSALIYMAGVLSLISSERCLEVVDRALRLSAEEKNSLLQAEKRARCLVQRLWTGGWGSRDAADFRNALDEIRCSADPRILAPHLVDYSFIQWISSDYRGAQQSVNEAQAIFSESSEENPYVRISERLGKRVLPWTLLFSGQWGDALHRIEEEMVIANTNADHYRGQTLRVFQAWVHLKAMDFTHVLTICQSLIPIFDAPEGSLWRRQTQVLAGTAEASLGNFNRALTYFLTVRDEIERRQVTFDWYVRMPLELGFAELWLAKHDLARARGEAQRFLNTTLATAERSWQALALEVNARVALAAADFDQAQDYMTKAFKTMEGFDLPLAEWVVHATAAEMYDSTGERELAERHSMMSRANVEQLATSLDAHKALRQTFLTAAPVRKILERVGSTATGSEIGYQE